MVWKDANDKNVRIYNFTYDNVNRLTAANFGQYASGGFSSSNVNYTVGSLTYDNNGNIKTMNQYGLKTGSTSGLIDQLTYSYSNTNLSNKLLNVADNANDPNSTLGDFHYPAATKSATTADYAYDNNGNLVTDANKKISSIVYNYLIKNLLIGLRHCKCQRASTRLHAHIYRIYYRTLLPFLIFCQPLQVQCFRAAVTQASVYFQLSFQNKIKQNP
ncbi:MAG: hypothetical protein PW786_12935 [Arachidicoccus sp.]|nr:hypothetical protein [Arachidicoccus sp.]